MARLTIPDEPTSVSFTATAQSAFPISFALFAKADLEVRVDDVWLTQSQFTFSGTLLEGGGYQGGTVTLNDAATGTVLIRRHIAPARTSNYAPSNNVPVRAIDMAFNRLTAVDQDMRRDLDRIEDDFAAVVTEAAAEAAAQVAQNVADDADRAEAAESGAIAAETEAQGWAEAAETSAGLAGTERDGAEAAKTDAENAAAQAAADALAIQQLASGAPDAPSILNKAFKDGSNIEVSEFRDALELGDAALKNTGATAGTLAAGDDARIVAVATKLNKVVTLADLEAQSATVGQVFVQCRASPGDGYAGTFEWVAGDQSANVTADPEQGVWVAPASDATGASGAWRRIYDGKVLWSNWFGVKADFVVGNIAGATNNRDALQAAFNFYAYSGAARLEHPAGLCLVEGDPIVAQGPVQTRGATHMGWALANIADSLPILTSGEHTVWVGRGSEITKNISTDRMITNCRNHGGVVVNPNAGESYTTSSGTALDTYSIFDFTNQDAVGTTPATPKLQNAFLRLTHHSLVENIAFRTLRADGSITPDSGDTTIGDMDWAIWCDNPYQTVIRGCHFGWAYRGGGILLINHDGAIDGFYPQGDRATVVENSFTCDNWITQADSDRARVEAVTTSTVTVAWSPSHRFNPAGGTIRINGTAYTYTSTTFTAGTPGTIRFNGLSADPVAAGVAAPSGTSFSWVMREEDYNSNGTGESYICYNFGQGFTHPNLRFSCDTAFSDRLPGTRPAIEIRGYRVRGTRVLDNTKHGRGDVLVQMHDCADIEIGGYAETKSIATGANGSRIIALSMDEMVAGRGGVTHPLGGVRAVRFKDDWNHTADVDCTPAFKNTASRGRFGTTEGLFAPARTEDPDYAYTGQNLTESVLKLPYVRTGPAHVIVDRDNNIRGAVWPSGKRVYGVSADWTTEPSNFFEVSVNGANFMLSRNNASTTAAGYICQNTAGTAHLVVDSSGVGNLRQNGVGRVGWDAVSFRPLTDNSLALGGASNRWSTVYAGTGTINTSDATLKDWRGPLTEAEIRVAKNLAKLIGIYQWKDAVAEKGEAARLHIGPTAQAVKAAFEAEGLDGFRYAVLCWDRWDDQYEDVVEVYEEEVSTTRVIDDEVVVEKVMQPAERLTGEKRLIRTAGETMGLRYDQLHSWIAAGFDARLSELED